MTNTQATATAQSTTSRHGDAHVALYPEAVAPVVVVVNDTLIDLPSIQAARDLRDALNDVLSVI